MGNVNEKNENVLRVSDALNFTSQSTNEIDGTIDWRVAGNGDSR